jgi:hypothetical protein
MEWREGDVENLRRTELRNLYARAEACERARWEAVRGRGPGQRGHDPDAWRKWMAPVKEMQGAAALLRSAVMRNR